MRRSDLRALSAVRHLSELRLLGAEANVSLCDLGFGSSLRGPLEELRGRTVLVATSSQLTAALALIELDGIVRRLVLCLPDLSREHITAVIAAAEVDTVVSDGAMSEDIDPAGLRVVTCGHKIKRAEVDRSASHKSEWILLTSGTTGVPKLVLHTLSSLTGAIRDTEKTGNSVVWSSFYDIRRYGGLQIFLRALLDGGCLVLSGAEESTGDFLTRAGSHGLTHISGTPSHWRRALMSPAARKIAPRYIRLSGEVVDQTILDHLRAFYPAAMIVHAFASTEAGVGFDVRDGRAGFPASLVGQHGADVEVKVEGGSLRIRSERTAMRYLPSSTDALADEMGFVDTRDMVDLRGDRYYFAGRRDGIINVGGMKVYPEEVEAAINAHPKVQMSLVKARRNPITGAVVVADVVLRPSAHQNNTTVENERIKSDILENCRGALAPYKVPVTIRFVQSLNVAASGKLARL